MTTLSICNVTKCDGCREQRLTKEWRVAAEISANGDPAGSRAASRCDALRQSGEIVLSCPGDENDNEGQWRRRCAVSAAFPGAGLRRDADAGLLPLLQRGRIALLAF